MIQNKLGNTKNVHHKISKSAREMVTLFIKKESSQTEFPEAPELNSVICFSEPISYNLSLVTLLFVELFA